jgi:hypothetical protein
MLLSETNADKIFRFAKKKLSNCFIYPVFEHGHWWVKAEYKDREELYDVIDVYGNTEIDLELIDITWF